MLSLAAVSSENLDEHTIFNQKHVSVTITKYFNFAAIRFLRKHNNLKLFKNNLKNPFIFQFMILYIERTDKRGTKSSIDSLFFNGILFLLCLLNDFCKKEIIYVERNIFLLRNNFV